jgi:hypothetical protein
MLHRKKPLPDWDQGEGTVQERTLTSAGYATRIGLGFAAALIESERTQAAPAKAMQTAYAG